MSLWKRPYGPGNQAASGVANTQGVQQSGPAAVPALQTVTVNTETQIVNGSNSALPLSASLEPNTTQEQIPFDVNVSGYLTTGTTTNVTLKVFSGVSTTIGSNTSIATSGAIAQNSASAPFFMRLKAIYDTVSGKLGGIFEGVINNTLFGPTALSAVITGISNSTNPVIALSLTVTFSAANAGNKINIADFSLG